MSYLTFNRFKITPQPQILWIVNHQIQNSQRINLGSYAILKPKVNWSNIDISDFDFSEQVLSVDICEIGKNEVIDKIKSNQPNIIIFAGTFNEIEPSEMEQIGWNINYSAKRYVIDDELGNTTSFYITSPTRLCIEAFSLDDYRISDKTYWYEIKKAVELWEEFR